MKNNLNDQSLLLVCRDTGRWLQRTGQMANDKYINKNQRAAQRTFNENQIKTERKLYALMKILAHPIYHWYKRFLN